MQKAVLKYFPLLFLAAVLLSCRSNKEPSDESVYTPSYIQQLGATDYQEAMHLADQAKEKGSLSLFKAYELKANLTYQFTEDYKSAASYINKALAMDEAEDPNTRTDLLYHLATIHRTAKEFPPCLEACYEGKEIAHTVGRIYDMHAFDFLAGSCLWDMGDVETGMRQMKEAIAHAATEADSEADYGHLAHFNSQLISIYIEGKEYNAALEQCSVHENLLITMQNKYPDAPAAFLDRSWFYLNMNQAVSYACLGNKRKASDAFSCACDRRFARTEGGALRQADYYSAIGDPANVLRIFTEEYPYSDPDTVTREYRGRLARIRDAYQNAGMDIEYALALARYNKLSDLLEAREQAEGLPEKAEQYDAQHYRLALSDALKALRNNRLSLAIMISVLIVALIVFLLLNRRINQLHRKDTSALEKDIRSLRRQVSLIAERDLAVAPKGSDKKALSLAELVEGNSLYLNKNLNRETAASLLGIPQAEITRMLKEIHPDLSFPDYVKGLRLRHAIKLLGENPDIPIAELADQCGFYSVRTFQRAFHTLTGKTPSGYAKDLKNK